MASDPEVPVVTIVLGGATLALLVATAVATLVFLTSGLFWPGIAAAGLTAVNCWLFVRLANRAARVVLKGGNRDV